MLKQKLHEEKAKVIWEAFGKYIARIMIAGKGVVVPKFGSFAFTPVLLDLAGTTNPNIRDRQERTPVFVVAKDFSGGVPLRAGIIG
jgi:hypothetical protein